MDFPAARVADEAEGRLLAGDPSAPGPVRAVIDSREAREDDLFIGLRGEHSDGGAFAEQALEQGAWGVLVESAHGARLASLARPAPGSREPAVIACDDALRGLQLLARAWRRELGCPTIGITGSTGKTSTKDILRALLNPHLHAHANRENLNTEIGLPLSLLEAPLGTEALVLEMAMRGVGQIGELVSIAEPDVGVIVNIGPVHLELLGTIEHVAAAKAEIIRDLPSGATCVVPAGEPLLGEHLRNDLDTVTFGKDGDVRLLSFEDGVARIDARGRELRLELPYSEPYNVSNTLAAVAAALAVGVTPEGRVDVRFSALRAELVELEGGIAVVNDCYNANPMSMRAALDELAVTASGRRVAVLGDMLELGEGERAFHEEVGAYARGRNVDLLVTVGPLAAAMLDGFDGEGQAVADAAEAASILPELLEPGDTVLVKGSRGVGLEAVAEALAEDAG
jgi:UDP-N-acetylmuramoyl-tripeptide--D-alanyl-D-alanine ligase